LRYLRSRLFILSGIFTFLFGLAMLHPYPRHSLFGAEERRQTVVRLGGADSIGAIAFDAIS
jgi:hypothetical protein